MAQLQDRRIVPGSVKPQPGRRRDPASARGTFKEQTT
jgi:hypothetical protein